MLSRVAESLYWMSRYIERAENTARFIDVNLNLILDMPTGDVEQWEPLVITSGDDAAFSARYQVASKENVIHFLTFDADNRNSILSCLRQARENARTVRESISTEMWEQINRFFLAVNRSAEDGRALELAHDFFTEIRMSSHLFVGMSEATMSRGEGWHFCRLGRMLERADKTSRILDVKYYILLPSVQHVGTAIDDNQWSAVLRSASGLEMYRQRFGQISPNKVVDFLVLDRYFPRAIQYCLQLADQSLHAISQSPSGTFSNLAEQRLGQLCSELAYANVDAVIAQGLHEFLDSLQTKVNLVGEAVSEVFFTLRPFSDVRRQVQ